MSTGMTVVYIVPADQPEEPELQSAAYYQGAIWSRDWLADSSAALYLPLRAEQPFVYLRAPYPDADFHSDLWGMLHRVCDEQGYALWQPGVLNACFIQTNADDDVFGGLGDTDAGMGVYLRPGGDIRKWAGRDHYDDGTPISNRWGELALDANDARYTCIHELGHALGLDHPDGLTGGTDAPQNRLSIMGWWWEAAAGNPACRWLPDEIAQLGRSPLLLRPGDPGWGM